VAGFTIVFG